MTFQPTGTTGDRNSLSMDDQVILETRVLPTARRWLDIPGLRDKGASTLAYWGESVPPKAEGRE